MDVDIDICRWILEFLLRQPTEERLLQKLVAVMPISDEDTRLKKTALLRTIENDVSDASVTERILELMELIEELDKREGIAASKSMKDAYCAVAVECSVKYFLVGKIDKKGKCVSAIKDIWRGRVTGMLNSGNSELVTAELKEWMDNVEEALWDANVRKKLTNMNTRNDALRSVLKYLGEAWAMLGPSFLQLNATLRDRDKKKMLQAGKSCSDCPIKARGKKVSFALDEVRDAGGNDRSELAIPFPAKNQPETRESVSKVSNEVETSTENLPNVSQDVGLSIKHTVKDAGGNGMSELPIPPENQAETRELVAKVSNEVEINTEFLPNVSHDVGGSTKKTEGEHIAAELVNQTEGPGLIQNVNERAVPFPDHCPRIDGAVEMHKLASTDKEKMTCLLPGQKHAVSSRHTRGVKITGPEELVAGTSSSLTAEVKEVQESLRSSMLELQAVVKDPLPNALEVSEALLENLGKKGDAASPSRSRAIEQNVTNDVANVNMCCSSQNNAPRPNLMERNSTACTFEWNDSGDTSTVEVENRTRLHLPNSMKRAVSPLKKYEATKFARRRKSRRWSLLEEDTLRTAVQKYGVGNWKLMWNCYRDIFEERTEVDLKDKWRNMTRY